MLQFSKTCTQYYIFLSFCFSDRVVSANISTIYFFHFVFQTGLSLLICYVVSRVLQHEYRELYRHLRTMYPEPPEWKLNAICFFVHTIIIYLHVVLRFDRGVICIVLSNIAVFLFLFKYSFCLHMYIVWLYGKG